MYKLKSMYSSKTKKNQFMKSDMQSVSEGDGRINSLPSLSYDENSYRVFNFMHLNMTRIVIKEARQQITG